MHAIEKNGQLGRFRLLKLVGEGAQGQIFLAEDPHLGRQVAIKTLTGTGGEVATGHRLFEEARAVSQLSHPNIVTLYDADEHDGMAYLVLEYVPGKTLDATLRRNGALPVNRAVEICVQVLDGIQCAHEHGILHRDIKPANVMIDDAGIARLMDFGVAQSMSVAYLQNSIVGTPRYFAPECLADGSFSAASDVYATAATLYEMLTGKPVVEGSSVADVQARIRAGKIARPSRCNPAIDERLEGIILRGLSAETAGRFSTAAEMKAALDDYRERSDVAAVQPGENGAIDFLLRRMQHKKDFPALSESMRAINRISDSSTESAATLSSVILKDFALTNKLLKIVNSPAYGHSGKVSTVSRAVIILGFDTVRSIAVTLLFLGHLQNKSQVENLQDEVIGTLLAGLISRELASGDKEWRESAFLYGIYQSLGRLLAYYYFFEEAIEIARLVEARGMDESAAAKKVLGVTYDRLAVAIAGSWNFPQQMLDAMRRLPADIKPGKPRDGRDRLRLAANLAEDLRQISLRGAPEEQTHLIDELVGRYKTAIPLTALELGEVASRACKAVRDEAQAMSIDVAGSHLFERLRIIEERGRKEPEPTDEIPESADMAHTMKVVEEKKLRETGSAEQEPQPDPHRVLTAGIQDITATLVGDFKLNDLLYMVIETMFSGMGFTRVMLAIRNEKTQRIEGRLGLGEGIEESLKYFSVPANESDDLFAAALRHRKDILISDAKEAGFRSRLPGWFRDVFDPASFILLPLIVDDRPFGLFYAEQIQAGRLTLEKTEADLLITLRNQAVLAIRQTASRR